jgi:ABC-2 type transport system ATP-binding protein
MVRAEKYLKKLGLWEKRDVTAQKLSGGMKRRLMIARGLVHEPRLLILDEPTAGVDVELRRGMWDFLEELNRTGRTIILTTHYLEEAERLCNRIGIISDGRIIENTSKRDLLRKLDRETFVFDTRVPLEGIPSFDQVEFTVIDETTVEATLNKELSLNQVFDHFNTHGIVINSMRTKTNRLEELFMEMVE